MKTIRSLGFALTAIFTLSACSSSGSLGTKLLNNKTEFKTIEKPGIANEDKLYSASNTAGIRLLQNICTESEGENAVFSPVSLSVILSLLENGASGRTREEINDIINPDKLSLFFLFLPDA